MKSHCHSGYLVAALIFMSSSFCLFSCKKNNNTAAPEITITGIPCVGLPLTFSCSAHAGSVYNWFFADTASTTEATPQFVFHDTGTYTITVYVNNDQKNPVTKAVVIYPALQITYAGTPIIGDTMTFQCTAPPGINITSYLWSFGDGSTSKSPTPKHSYTSNGPADVNLTVNDYTNDTVSQIFAVVPDPVYTSALAATWNWQHNHTVFDSGFSNSNDTSFAITMVNEAIISIGSINLEYEPLNSFGNNIVYGYSYLNISKFNESGTYILNFNHSTNQVQYTVNVRTATGGGYEDSYQSY